ncbi:XRE family transcriptional regulator [Kitasatospora sp. NPDC048540]|uniref:MmyB family transcriptional regulator n=1 Tax=unclassified Kitasatospora TaxID=2633591 RepID=UPI00053BBE62|nr:hypothetical protein [Kitasatospora sp. MBT63]
MDRKALQKLLTACRGRVDPSAYGFERREGRGRRAVGLSQYQMDRLLMRAEGTYGRFERGDLDNPSLEFLRDVGRTLKMSEREWTALWLYGAGHQPPCALAPAKTDPLPDVWRGVVDGITHIAYVNDAGWNVVAHNAAAAAMFPRGQMPANVMRWMALDQEAREFSLPDWERTWAPAILSQLRAAHATYPENEDLARLDAEVKADPCAGPIYDGPLDAYIHPDGDERPIVHAQFGPGRLRMATAQPLGSPGSRLMIMTFRFDD